MKKILLLLFSTLIFLILLEVGVRFIPITREAARFDGSMTPLHIRCSGKHLYRQNPDHPEISSQGLRDKEYPTKKVKQRILVLGDSLVFGEGVSKDMTFPKVLEKRLPQVDVINAGVMGYTPYNALHFYLEELRAFKPDMVLVAFCYNDIVNPRLHWNHTKNAIPNIPDEAIPNLEYDKKHVLPIIEAKWDAEHLQSSHPSLLMRSRLYYFLTQKLFKKPLPLRDEQNWTIMEKGKSWPIYVTGEDSISIKTLTEYESPEWRWLRTIYDQLHGAVKEDGIKLGILVFPLAYQLDLTYPFSASECFKRYSKESLIPVLDLLPVFRQYRNERLFFGEKDGFIDIWHLTGQGHFRAAEAVETFIKKELL